MVRMSRVLLIGLIALATAPALAQGERRLLMVGQDVKPGDQLTTAAGEQKALLAPDGASLTIGPNSEVVLDRFQFDAATKAGEFALTVRRGSLRFGGGSISKANDVVVAAGTSQVRIRGATAAIGVQPEGVEVRMVAGERVSVTAEGATQTLSQPDGVIAVPAGKPPVVRTASTARPDDWAKSFRELDNLSRNTARAVESSQGTRVTPTPGPTPAPGR
jgi:hypothetical protein